MAPILTVRDVVKRYREAVALDGVSLELDRGQVLALLGANGAGKTTLIKCIVGLAHFEGAIAIDGHDVATQGTEARRRLGYLPQHPALHVDLTVAETAMFYADLRGASGQEARDVVERVGLTPHAAKAVGALSGGMRQRLGLAVALLSDPPLLVLDEPTSGLDVASRLELRQLLLAERERGRTIILSTHWWEDVPYVADRVLVLEQGRERFLGEATALASILPAFGRLYLRVNAEVARAVSVAAGIAGEDAAHAEGDWLVVSCLPAQKGALIGALLAAGIAVLDIRVDETAAAFVPAEPVA